MKKVFEKAIILINVIFTIWCVISYAEIISKNTQSNPSYNEHNVIINIVEVIK